MEHQKPRKLELTSKQLEAVARARQRKESTKVNEEWLFVAEFGFYYGWQGIEALLGDENLTIDVANKLIAGARKVWSGHLYDHASATLFGSAAAQSRKPEITFDKLTKDILKQAKADI